MRDERDQRIEFEKWKMERNQNGNKHSYKPKEVIKERCEPPSIYTPSLGADIFKQNPVPIETKKYQEEQDFTPSHGADIFKKNPIAVEKKQQDERDSMKKVHQ